MSVTIPEVRVGQPLRYKSLSVFPLFTESNGNIDYLLADEAIREKLLTVEEVSEAGSVPDLLVENKGNTRVLFIEGEELIGAKQNRILNTSILVAAKSKARIPVSCVEQGRWGYKSKFFGSSGSHSPSKLRYAMKSSVTQSLKAKQGRRSDQGKVWEEVAALQDAHGVESPTGAMSDTFDAYEDQVTEYRQKLKYVDGASGMAVSLGDKIVGCDLFDKPSTCQKFWDRLLSGHVFGALETNKSNKESAASEIEEMIKTTSRAAWELAEPIGEGTEYRAEFDHGEHASALTLNDSLVHGSVLASV
jgi:hypothetical protein